MAELPNSLMSDKFLQEKNLSQDKMDSPEADRDISIVNESNPLQKNENSRLLNSFLVTTPDSLNNSASPEVENLDKLISDKNVESGIEISNSHSAEHIVDGPSLTDEAVDSINSSLSESLQKDTCADERHKINESNSQSNDKNDIVNASTVEIIEFLEEETSCLSSDENEMDGSGSESDLEDNAELDDDPRCHFQKVWRIREENPTLPETVTLLRTPEGSKVYLVGTAHFSLSSQEDVATTIRATQPDIVMVELCKSRVNILSLDEKTVLEESKNMNLEKLRAAVKQNGLIQGVMYLLLLSMSAHLTKQLGMAPGGEFRRAFSEAKKVPGCLVQLGDRPIQITLQRALSSLSWWQKLRLAWYMLTCKEPISKEEVEKCKKKDLLEEMLAEMTGEFPALSRVFVKERDIYLAYSLKLAASPLNSSSASTVVGVVGIGHVPGIVENWDKVTESDILPILKIPESSLTTKVLCHTFRISLLGLTVWGCYRYLLPSSLTDVILSRRPFEWISQLFSH
ncbi:traB domain-containing protein-like isoform X1 [Centruroides sculpturatus]|uniref:traB domain-containing protein-like isoform X1 n=1 Tax=Centruroides sculpturatus TaxID=218467 RepID=UPI000C6E8800|nr:traB domain-containing protein-like isoform X1 [Centruroides sculpturatus]